MEKFLHFIENHWLTWLALVVVLVLLVYEELRSKMSGVQRLSPQDLTQMLNHDEAVVVDVRDNAAFDQGHILGSIHIPQSDLIANINKIEKYKDKAIVILDGASQGIGIAAKLRAQGFKLYALAGGLDAWRSAGLPLTKK